MLEPTDPNKAALELGQAIEIPVVPSGEALCQAIPSWWDVYYPDNSRCLYIARSSTDYLYVFLSDSGKALVFHFTSDGPTMEEQSVPALPDLAHATLSVDKNGSVNVSIGDGLNVVIPTSNWGFTKSDN